MKERTAWTTRLCTPSSRGSDGTSVASIATWSSITVRTTVLLSVTPSGVDRSRVRRAAARRPSGADSSVSSRNTRSLGSTSKVRSASRASTSGSGRTDRSMRPTSAKMASTRSAVITSWLALADRSPTLRTRVASAGRASNWTFGSLWTTVSATSPSRTLSPATSSVSSAIRPPPTKVPHRLPRSATKHRSWSTRNLACLRDTLPGDSTICDEGERPATVSPGPRS